MMDIAFLMRYFSGLMKVANTVVGYANKWAANIESAQLATIVVRHAIAAAVAGMAGGVLPGIAVLVSSVIAIGAIWHMYYAVGKYLHLKFGKDILKATAAAILSNVIHQMWGVLAIEFAATFIPLLSIPATGLIFFAITYFSGMTFLLVLEYIFKAGGDPTSMSAEELKRTAERAAGGIDFRGEFEQSKQGFKRMRREGNLEDLSKGVDINSD
ncbi:MAG: hypothetical protein IJP86_10255 [Synergistaceae bacterium]|nr:hypothetical protein [Synergistaceae bacterium]